MGFFSSLAKSTNKGMQSMALLYFYNHKGTQSPPVPLIVGPIIRHH